MESAAARVLEPLEADRGKRDAAHVELRQAASSFGANGHGGYGGQHHQRKGYSGYSPEHQDLLRVSYGGPLLPSIMGHPALTGVSGRAGALTKPLPKEVMPSGC
jgi:hypothetical protein